MGRQQTVRQADTQYAKVTILRHNWSHYQIFSHFWSKMSFKSKYPKFKKYNRNSMTYDDGVDFTCYHVPEKYLPQKYNLPVNSKVRDKVTKDQKKIKKNKKVQEQLAKSKNKPVQRTYDKKTNTSVLKKQSKSKITYYVVEYDLNVHDANELFTFELIYSSLENTVLDNHMYVDGKLVKDTRPFPGDVTIFNRNVYHKRLSKGKHTVTYVLDDRTTIYSYFYCKLDEFKADTLNNEYLTLNKFSLSKTTSLDVTEATIELFAENFMFKEGYPYYPEKSESRCVFGFRDEVNIEVKDNTGKMRRIFGGYVSTISLDDDGLILTLSCGDRAIDMKNRYILTETEIYDGANATDYTDILKKYYDRWGGVFDGLAKSVEIPLTTNVDRNMELPEEKAHYGLNLSYDTVKSKSTINYVKKYTSHITVGVDDSYKNKTNYLMLRNGREKDTKQWANLYDIGHFNVNTNKILLNKYPILCIDYGLGAPKKEIKGTGTSSTSSTPAVSGSYQNRAKQLIEGVTGTTNQARKIFDYCRKAISYESYTGCKYSSVDQVLKVGHCNCYDSATVLTNMWRAAGISAGYVTGTMTDLTGTTYSHGWSYFVDEKGKKIECDVGRQVEQWNVNNNKSYTGHHHKKTLGCLGEK